MTDRSDLLILGAGVAGLSAAVHAARLGLSVRVLDRMGPGGQVMNAGALGGVPGLPKGVIGADLIGRLTDQAVDREVDVAFGDVVEVVSEGGFVVRTDADSYEASAVVSALGTRPRPMGVRREDELEGKGLSHCAQCDGDLFRGDDVIVVGGGDAALHAAAHLAGRARTVTIVHRGSVFDGAKELVVGATSAPNVNVLWGAEVRALIGEERLTGVIVSCNGEEQQLKADGIFPEVGRLPHNDALAHIVELDATGRIVVNSSMATSHPGVFAAGACRAGDCGEIITSMADGVAAAISAGAWLSTTQTG
jgi:thioredoxin reductase (NADPH)